MRLTVLGSGSCVPSLKRGAAGYLVRTAKKNILVDMGLGTIHKLLQQDLTYTDIDVLCFTHTHPDHVSELVPFLFACKYGEIKREKDLVILGGEGFKVFFESLVNVYHDWLISDDFTVDVRELVHASFDDDGVGVKTVPVKHSRESVAFRISEKKKNLVFSGDTGYCPEMVDFSRGADLLVLECSTPNLCELETHLNPASAGRIAVESGCERLLLSHFYPACDQFDIASECGEVYQGNLVLAEDLMEIDV